MGRLLVFVVLIVIVVGALGWWGLMLENRRERSSMGLRGSKKRLRALQTSQTRMTAALQEIRDIAAASSTAAKDPAFDYIFDKAEQALTPQKPEDKT